MQTFGQFWYSVGYYSLDIKPLDYLILHQHFDSANGCGRKGGIKFPSTMWGVNIEVACNLHDLHWELAKSYQDLVDGNKRFEKNLKKICDKESNNVVTQWLRRLRIAKYVTAVEIHGLPKEALNRGFI